MVLNLIHEPRTSIRMALLTKQIGMRRDEFTSTTLCQLRKLTKSIVSCKNQTNKQTKIKHFTSRITLSYRTVVALTSCYGIGQHRRPRRARQKKDIVKERNGRKLWSAVSKYIGAVFCHVYT